MMNSAKNISVIRWFEYQYSFSFSFDQCGQGFVVLHTKPDDLSGSR